MSNPRWISRALLLASAAALIPPLASAQSAADGAAMRIQGPPPPAPPAVMARDERRNVTVRAVRLGERPRIDGRLDEGWYRDVPPITGFIQSLPDEGAPATEETEVWIGFDEANVYVSARLHDSAPESRWVANDLRRDGIQLRQNEQFSVMLDTYYDRRNGVVFSANPLGARVDAQFTNEGSANLDWNPIWDVRTGRFDGGWTVEMEIPFKSLRYSPGVEQVWGLQLRRGIRYKNEWAHLTPVSRSVVGTGLLGIMRASAAGTLVGIEAPPASRVFEVKPYGISGLRTDRAATPALSNDPHADFGLDLKYGITQNLTADFTLNTDFAQVEVDQQQVNLTRFNVSFPEKRDFFLEGRGIFGFATPPAAVTTGATDNMPTLFFSRRIGLEGGEPVPILGGARLTGKVGAFDVGALSVQADEHLPTASPSTNFSAVRVRRDVFRRSSVGALFTHRSESVLGDGSSQTYGVDGNFSFFENLYLTGFLARTRTPGLDGDDLSYQGRLTYEADRYGLTLDHLLVGDDFDPQLGFLRRDDLRQSSATARFSPRPASIAAIRRFNLVGALDYLESARGGYMESRARELGLGVELENSDNFHVDLSDQHETLVTPFRIAPGVEIPVGGYAFRDVTVGYDFGLQRRASGSVRAQHGTFYSGTRTSVEVAGARINGSTHFFLEPGVSLNWVDLEEGSFTTHLLTTRLTYSFNPRMFVAGLAQYNSSNQVLGANLRLRWEYAPGSELFVVYTDDRSGDPFERFPDLTRRSLVIKVTRMFRP